MSLSKMLHVETNLVGRIVTSNVEPTDTTIYASFEDKKTGDARTPQSTTKLFVLSKDSSRFEIIYADSHTTSGGITTITVNAAGRNLNKYGGLSGSATGNRHVINSEIGCATTHLPVEELLLIMEGTNATGANVLRVGNETDADIYFYAQNGDTNKPFLFYDASENKWMFSNNGTDTAAIGGSTASYSSGDGIDITAGVISTDLKANGGLKITATELEVDLKATGGITYSSGLVLDLTHAGYTAGPLATVISDVTATSAEINKLAGIGATVDAAALTTLTAGPSSNADSEHTHAGLGGAVAFTAGEAIDGSTTPQFLCQASDDQIATINIHNGGTTSSVLDWDFNDVADTNMGDADGSTRRAQSFTFTDAAATTIKVEKIRVFMQKVTAPTDNLTIEIHGNSTNKPDNISQGASSNVSGAGLSTTYKWIEFTFASPVTVTTGTKYWAVMRRSGANDAVNYYQIGSYGADKYSSHGNSTYTASTTTWSAENANDYGMQIQASMDFDNKVLKLDANDLVRGMNYVGTTTDNVAADASISVLPLGNTESNFTGLTPCAPYFASVTAGSYSATESHAVDTALVYVGTPYSATQMGLKSGMKSYHAQYQEFNFNETGSAASFDFAVVTGFRPSKITVRYLKQEESGPANDCMVREQIYYVTTSAGGLSITGLDASGVMLNAASTIVPGAIASGATDSVAPSALHNNGFDMRVNQGGTTDEPMLLVEIIAEGY